MRIGNREFDTENGVYVMGILNVTPDSFSDGGRWLERDAALRQAAKMAAEGAAIIDIGGESTRPGHSPVGAEEEAARVLPVIAAVKRETGLPVSVDTYRHETARLALEAGADMINDIWGLRYDGGEMARLIAQSGAACCLMHNRKSAEYRDFMPELLEDLRGTLDLAAAAGIARERIILDPGIGFAKSCEQNLTAMHRLDELAALGCPVLLAASRKSVVGLSLGLPVEERLEGTLATTAIGVLQGATFVRVHDVKENLRAARMALAIRREARPGEGA
ncbi:MAG TPA: dihydropteroate synthase [Candidatus Scatomorpha intestinigallinarum]|uniref:Dihydropteroate synthase n=1 Tax=Candidatus Scatomorpha intestinigallinarum TaxID=2840923 RepID=A0A9D1DM46_9FIRM|nr:dihydropteroate synthase [Candidatus Scatomorpha intestinigallinarum]